MSPKSGRCTTQPHNNPAPAPPWLAPFPAWSSTHSSRAVVSLSPHRPPWLHRKAVVAVLRPSNTVAHSHPLDLSQASMQHLELRQNQHLIGHQASLQHLETTARSSPYRVSWLARLLLLDFIFPFVYSLPISFPPPKSHNWASAWLGNFGLSVPPMLVSV
jgi:hypothetical protein